MSLCIYWNGQSPDPSAAGAHIQHSWGASSAATVETAGRLLTKLHTPTMQPAITLLGIYPKELKTCPHKSLQMMFTAALFIIAQTWKQPRCPLIGEWMKKLWYIGQWNISHLKRNELSGHNETRRKLKRIQVREANEKRPHTVTFQPVTFWKR